MKHLIKFKIFEKDEYTGKVNTYRLTNIHKNEEGDLVGRCRKCGQIVDVADQTHPSGCEYPVTPDGVKKETYWLNNIRHGEDNELIGNCKKCDATVSVIDKEHYAKCCK